MSFSILQVILTFLLASVMSQDSAESEPSSNEINHTSENWMIYGPILVAILLIISCVFSCKLRNWYKHNQLIKMRTEEKEDTVVLAISPENHSGSKTEYRLLMPEYRVVTPSQRSANTSPSHVTTPTLNHVTKPTSNHVTNHVTTPTSNHVTNGYHYHRHLAADPRHTGSENISSRSQSTTPTREVRQLNHITTHT